MVGADVTVTSWWPHVTRALPGAGGAITGGLGTVGLATVIPKTQLKARPGDRARDRRLRQPVGDRGPGDLRGSAF